MIKLIKQLVRESLLEAVKSRHWVQDSYPIRIEDSRYGGEDGEPLSSDVVSMINKNISFVESLEFSNEGQQKIGIWLYDSPKEIFYPPFQRRDKGKFLLAIINNNTMTTMYWKHKYEGQYDYDIRLRDLIEFTNSEFYDAKTKPISIRNIEAWVDSKKPKPQPKAPPTPNTNRFKKLKLADGNVVRYYKLLNKFETLDGKPLEIDDIFDSLPAELQDTVLANLD